MAAKKASRKNIPAAKKGGSTAKKRIKTPLCVQSATPDRAGGKAGHIKVTDNTPKESPVTLMREKMQFAFSSPAVYSVRPEHLASQTARYAGMFFVVVGALFTFINIQELNGFYATLDEQVNVAEVVCSDPNDSNYDLEECESGSGSSGSGEEDSMDPCDPESSVYDQETCDAENYQPCEDPDNPDYYSSVCGYTGDACDSPLHPDYDADYCESTPGSCDPESPNYDADYCEGSPEDYCDDPDDLRAYTIECGYTGNACSDPAFPDYNADYCSNDPVYDSCDTNNPDFDESQCAGETFSCDTADPTYDEARCVEDHYSCDPSDPYYNADACSPDDTTTDDDTETDDVANDLPVYLSFDKDKPFQGKVVVSTEVSDATKVAVFVNGMFKELMDNVSADVWEFVWDTVKMADGKHEVYVKVYLDSGDEVYSDGVYVETENGSTETIENPTLVDETTEEEGVEASLRPAIGITVGGESPMRGNVDIVVTVESAEFVEVYALPSYSNTPHFLGLARKTDPTTWRYTMETERAPNGGHKVFARVKNSFGIYESKSVYIVIENEITNDYTADEEAYVKEIEETDKTVQDEFDRAVTPTDDPMEENASPDKDIFNEANFEDVHKQQIVEEVLRQFRSELRAIMDELAVAVRNDDTARIEELHALTLDLRARALKAVQEIDLPDDILRRIDMRTQEIIEALREVTERNERIIKERVGEKVFNDSDKDSISDYDEVNLYGTDPFSADSDGDGFTDGAEVLGGFDPNDSRAEALVTYESPKEAGVVREDLLTIEDIETVTPDTDESSETTSQLKAKLQGKALPNSFVTLYVFSTPIIVTVKTDDDGSWEYTFDKELEDGAHEVYVGITDNAGHIVAKSNPLPFVKTAEAFTPIGSAEATSPPTPQNVEPAVLTEKMILIVLSIGVVAIGILLLLLGLHIRTRQADPALGSLG